jgi:hypothetical protein
VPSEYSNLFGFALASEKWRDRYDFQIVPNARRPVLAVASHKLGACAAPAETIRDRDADAFLAANLGTLVFPRDAAPYRPERGSPGLAENRWNGRVNPRAWAAYERRVRETPTFGAYLGERQAALRNRSAGLAAVSPGEACPGAAAAWAACFEAVRPTADAVWEGRDIYRPADG